MQRKFKLSRQYEVQNRNTRRLKDIYVRD